MTVSGKSRFSSRGCVMGWPCRTTLSPFWHFALPQQGYLAMSLIADLLISLVGIPL